jgi:hypothetical protein
MARDAAEWATRAAALERLLTDGMRRGELERWAELLEVPLPETRREIKPWEKYSWKIISPTLRTKSTFLDSVRAMEDYRSKLCKWLQRYHGVVAIFASLDVGKNGVSHMHLLVYSPFIARAKLIHYQKSIDCRIPGCAHGAYDETCGGSFDIDIRQLYAKRDSKGHRVKGGVREVLKYAVSPKADSDHHVALFLAMYRKHRVQTYGLANRKLLVAVEEAYEDEHVRHMCPVCSKVMPIVLHGYIKNHIVRLKTMHDTR